MLIPAGVTIMWPGTNASIPAGWTRVNSMDDRHPKGTAGGVDPDVPGGAATHIHIDPGHTHSIGAHTHTAPASGLIATGGVFSDGFSNTGIGAAHTHTIPTSDSTSSTSGSTAGAWAAGSSDPSYYGVIWIASDGTPTGFPALSWAFWDKVASLPTTWSNPAAARNVFPKGAPAAGNGGGTGGGAHVHTGSGHLHIWNGHTHSYSSASGSTAPANKTGNAAGGSNLIGQGAHTHAVNALQSGTTLANSATSADAGSTSYEPPWAKLAIVQNDTGAQNAQIRHVAVWLGLLSAIPSNWQLCDGTNSTVDMRGKFVKGANGIGEIGNTGGTAGHSHSNPAAHSHAYDHSHLEPGTFLATTTASTATNGTANGSTPPSTSSPAHSHVGSGVGDGPSDPATGTSGTTVQTAPSTADTQPAFRTTAFIVLLSDLSVTLTAPLSGATVTNPSPTISWSLSGGSGVQNDYQIKVYRSDGITLQYDSGLIASASLSVALSTAANLLNNSSYYVQVTIHDTSSPAQLGATSLTLFHTAWTPPATITGVRSRAVTEENNAPW